ncbi:hypothetical protein T11_17530 [Trichinella zimbabwensis]|nr:hypothetical protein T11_3875 [Trichinella zimbabwensis]KRY99394.1 hypothetical protein T11_5227 [Trichinella zimbabwensis]KRY99445.1 hypothetical protein T11_17530 [Trichinella zimbabwensis]
MIIQVGIMAFLNSCSMVLLFRKCKKQSCMLYGSSGLRHNNCCILPLWYYELASMRTKGELPLSPSRHHSYQNGMSAFTSVSNVVSRASLSRSVLAVVAMKVIHSGSQFRVVYGKE